MWSKTFGGLEAFRAVMGRDQFKLIPSEIRFYPSYDPGVATKDPVWNRRLMLQHFGGNFVKVTVRTGVSDFEDNTKKYKSRTGSLSY